MDDRLDDPATEGVIAKAVRDSLSARWGLKLSDSRQIAGDVLTAIRAIPVKADDRERA